MRLGPFEIRRSRPEVKATLGGIQSTRSPNFISADTWAPAKYSDYYIQSVPAYRAIKLRADAISSAPLIVYKRGREGDPEPVDSGHPIQSLLDRVNGWWTRADLWKATETYLSIWGSAFWFLDRSSFDEPTLWALRPDKVRILPDRGGGANRYILGYEYAGESGRRIPLRVDEVIWFRYFNPQDEYAGLSPIASARLSLDMGKDALRFNREFFRNSAIPSDVVWTVTGPVNEEEVEAFYARLEKRFRGPANAHRPLVWDLSQGAEPKRLGLSQRDMEFLATLNWTVEDAARVWGIPPPKLYSQVQSTYNNVKQADIEFYSDTVSSEWRFLESEVTELLLPILAPGEDLFCAFDTSNILALQDAMAEQYARVREDVKLGILTPNEARAARGLPPVSWGDSWWVPITLVPADGTGVGGGIGGGSSDRSANISAGRLEHEQSAFLRVFSQSERLLLRLQRALFLEQERAVLEQLSKRSIPVNGPVTVSVNGGEERALSDEAFSTDIWIEAFRKRGLPVMSSVLIEAARRHSSSFGLGPFDESAFEVQEFISERLSIWSQSVNNETARLLMEEISEGARLGEGIPALQDRVRKVFRFSFTARAETIARTETLSLSNEGHLLSYRQSGVVERKMWLATKDDRTRESHLAADRQVVGLDEPFIVGGEQMDAPGIGGSAENTVNCILPGSLIYVDGLVAAFSAFYTGPALEIITELGHSLSVTPNHPILTDRGFVPAKFLCPGNKIISGAFEQRMSSADEHITNVPSLIEEIFSALSVISAPSSAVIGTVSDFHGDARFIQSDIDIVRPNGELRRTVRALLGEPVIKKALSCTYVLERALPDSCSESPLFCSVGLASDRLMSGFCPSTSVLGSHSRHSGQHPLTAVSWLDPMLYQVSSQYGPRDSEFICQGLLGFPGQIATETIAKVRDFNFSGHVYDLQSMYGLYNANGLFVHNCRCTVVPVIE